MVWDARTGKALATRPGRGHVFNMAFSPDGRWLALGMEDGSVEVVDWENGGPAWGGPKHRGAVTGLVFSQDGTRLASAGADRVLLLWDCAARSVLRQIEVPNLFCDLAFSPDGQRLAGVSRDLVKLWDVQTGQDLLALRGAPPRHRDPPFNPRLAFSPDGLKLAASNWDESISLWEATGPSPQRQDARRRAAEERASIWHLEEAERCFRVKNVFAASFHLGRLKERPLPELLRERAENLARVVERQPVKGPR
jgi:WD40 repeat protein